MKALTYRKKFLKIRYQGTLVLTEKSDVYSFGVILLEIVTGEPPILNTTENIHIVRLVKENLDKGNIEDVIDSRLKGEYDMNSVWKVVELAMMCTREKSTQRPTMADVVIHLKDCVQMEEHRQKELHPGDKLDVNISSISTSFSITPSFVPASR
jgi:serine/threonine protein kinase